MTGYSGTINFALCDTLDDVALAVEEALRKVQEGYTSGHDANESGGYTFTVTSSPEQD
jgi:hypothetical protein